MLTVKQSTPKFSFTLTASIQLDKTLIMLILHTEYCIKNLPLEEHQKLMLHVTLWHDTACQNALGEIITFTVHCCILQQLYQYTRNANRKRRGRGRCQHAPDRKTTSGRGWIAIQVVLKITNTMFKPGKTTSRTKL